MPAGSKPWRMVPEGLLLRVRLTPNASRDVLAGIASHGDESVFQVKVRAVPEKGKANTALERLVSKSLGLPANCVTLRSGGKSRMKTLLLSGSAPELVEKLELLLDDRD